MKNYAESMKIRDLAIITKSQFTSNDKDISLKKEDESQSLNQSHWGD